MQRVRPVLIGLGTTFVFIMMLQTFGTIFWPVPPGVNLNDEQALRAAQAAAPLAAKLYTVLSYGIAVFIGAFLARKIAGGISTTPSWMVGVVYTLLCGYVSLGSNVPVWMKMASLLLPLPAAWLGLTAAAERRRITPGAGVKSS